MGQPTLIIQNILKPTQLLPQLSMITTKTPLKSFFKIVFSYARPRRNSDWIYSNKAEEMSHARKGRVYVCSHTGSDSYNCTIRMHKTLEGAHLVLSQRPSDTAKLLHSLATKMRYSEQSLYADSQALQTIKDTGELVSYNKQQAKQRDFDSVLQHSKYLEMAMEVEKISKSNNDRDNKILKKQQEQLNKFLESSNTRDKLETFKKENGYPRIVQLLEHFQKINELRNGGINIFCFLDEYQPSASKALFAHLEENKIPYEVLPAVNHIVNLLASSGFPADRFAIEYFPNPVVQALQKRRSMKMTVGIVLEKKDLLNTVEAIKQVYGGENLLYIESEQGKMIYRGKADEIQTVSLSNVIGHIVRIALAPYISTFNEGLKEERNKVDRLYGEAMSNNTHFVRMEFINRELKDLLKRKDTRKVSVNALIQQLMARAGKEKTALIAADVLGLKAKEADVLVKRAEGETVMDHLGLDYLSRKK